MAICRLGFTRTAHTARAVPLLHIIWRPARPSLCRPRHLVRLLYNEQAVRLPGCAAAGAQGMDCDLEEFVAALRPRAEPETLELLCGSAAPGGPTVAGGI